MGRKRMYTDAAEKQQAYRRRGGAGSHQATRETAQDIVTPPQGRITQRYDIAPRLPPVQAAGGHSGGVYQHTAAPGLLVRVLESLPGDRVRAVVLAPGQSNLTAGTAYPFRVELLNEVAP